MIPTIIPEQNFEIVCDAIAGVLLSEFNNQVDQFYNTKCAGVSFWRNRLTPLDKTESGAIIISPYKANYDELQAIGIQDGRVQYMIRIMANSPTIEGTDGDELAGARLQELIGLVRYILMHPVYVNLGLTPGFIGHTELSNWQIGIRDIEIDATGTHEAFMVFSVDLREDATVLDGPVCVDSATAVRLSLTGQGFQYGQSYTPPLDPRYVYIVDQYGNILQLVPGGETYTVTRLQRIIDNFPNNQLNIIDNILPE